MAWAAVAGIFLFPLASISTAAPNLKVIVPDNDLWNYPSSSIRIAGNTQPGNRITVNGREIKVYPTGAFVDRVSLNEGNNTLTIIAHDSVGSATVSRTIRRSEAAAAISPKLLTISNEGMMPADNLDLLPGDLIEVRFKGTPGGKAAFSLGKGLRDLPMTETALDGVAGYYTGVYRIQQGDRFDQEKIEFTLEVKGLGRTEKKSPARVVVEPRLWPRVAIMEDPNPFLLAGRGEARLGGAQLGNLSQGPLLELTGRIDDLYRVRLSATRSAWVPVNAVRELPAGTHPPRTLVGSSTLRGNERADELLLPLEQRVPYLLEPSVDPPALFLHLFGATSNLTWMTRHLSAEAIQRVAWEQESEDHLKFRLELASLRFGAMARSMSRDRAN
jgi:N-acetylmuramoyl-L-alanine amidase